MGDAGMRCRHQWAEVSRKFNHPPARLVTIERATPAIMEQVLHGFTAIELRCECCGDVKGATYIGRAS